MRTTFIFFFLLLFFCFSPAYSQENTIGIIGSADDATSIHVTDDSTFLQKQGLRLTHQMQLLANEVDFVSVHAKRIKSWVEDIGKQSYDTPRKIFCIQHLQTEKIKELLSQSGVTKPLLIDRLLRAIPTQINAREGSDILAATSLLTTEDAFLYPDLKEYTLYLYLYKGNYQSMVLFRPGKNHIVLANASIVVHKGLQAITTTEDVKRFFAEVLKMKEVKVKEFLP